MHWQQELLVGGGDHLMDDRGLGPLVQHPICGLDLVLPVHFGDLGLGRGAGCYGWSGRGLDRGHMGLKVGDE